MLLVSSASNTAFGDDAISDVTFAVFIVMVFNSEDIHKVY